MKEALHFIYKLFNVLLIGEQFPHNNFMRKLLIAPRTIVNKFLQVPEGILDFESDSFGLQWVSYYVGALHKSVNLSEFIFSLM